MSKGRRIPLWEAEGLAQSISLQLHKEGVKNLICGSIRRGIKATVGDLDFVVSDLSVAARVLNHNVADGRKTVKFDYNGMNINLYVATDEEWGAMVLFLTGNGVFNKITRWKAKEEGFKLNQYGLWRGEVRIAGKDEYDILDKIGMRRVSPSDREK